MLSGFSHVRLFVTLWIVACQSSSVHGVLQEGILKWVAMSLRHDPLPRDLPDPRIEPMSPVAPAMQPYSLPLSHWGGLILLIAGQNHLEVSPELKWAATELKRGPPVLGGGVGERTASGRQGQAHSVAPRFQA